MYNFLKWNLVENISRIGGKNSFGSYNQNSKDLFIFFANQTERGFRSKKLKLDMNSSFFTSQIQLATQLILRHYFLQIVSPFPLKLELKMKAANVGEIKLGGTENKWICRKNCGCKPLVHTYMYFYVDALWIRNLNTPTYLWDKIMKLQSIETSKYVISLNILASKEGPRLEILNPIWKQQTIHNLRCFLGPY